MFFENDYAVELRGAEGQGLIISFNHEDRGSDRGMEEVDKAADYDPAGCSIKAQGLAIFQTFADRDKGVQIHNYLPG